MRRRIVCATTAWGMISACFTSTYSPAGATRRPTHRRKKSANSLEPRGYLYHSRICTLPVQVYAVLLGMVGVVFLVFLCWVVAAFRARQFATRQSRHVAFIATNLMATQVLMMMSLLVQNGWWEGTSLAFMVASLLGIVYASKVVDLVWERSGLGKKDTLNDVFVSFKRRQQVAFTVFFLGFFAPAVVVMTVLYRIRTYYDNFFAYAYLLAEVTIVTLSTALVASVVREMELRLGDLLLTSSPTAAMAATATMIRMAHRLTFLRRLIVCMLIRCVNCKREPTTCAN